MSDDRGEARDKGQDRRAGSAIEEYVVKDPEAFSRNLARAVEQAGKVAAAWVEPREKGEAQDSVAEPFADIVKTFSKVSEYWLSDPARALEAQTRLFSGYMDIWSNSIRRMSGQPVRDVIEPPKGDKRFQDKDWAENAFFDFLKQAYLVMSKWATELVEQTEGLDPHTRHKAAFYVKQIANAVAPSNFILTNPELFKETVATSGANLVAGMKMLAEDIAAGHGDLKLRQSDYSRFALGENMALTPGKVIARSDVAEIIQYAPATAKVLKRPLLICPPWINKYYILDLNPEKSFIRWAVENGHTVFVISWVNPDERHAAKDWEAYIREGLVLGLDTIEKATGEKAVNAVGYCVGGTLLAAAMALLKREGDTRIKSATFFATQVDFVHCGDLKVFVDEAQISDLEAAMKQKGFLEGTRMAMAFNMLRSNDLIWPYVVNNYMKGQEPLPFDLLYWNSDSTRMTAANHSYYLRNCYLENNLSHGRMVLAGKRISLKDVKVPVYNLATKEDHIAPALSVFEGSASFGGDVTYVLSGSGHIAGVINPPGKNKYQYWTNGAPAGNFESWLAGAEEHQGSWWPHWQKWVTALDKRRVPAREPGGGRLNPIDEAPGSYVRVRA
jgi:polyhydroxyalkanoate synthase subunit PhaC